MNDNVIDLQKIKMKKMQEKFDSLTNEIASDQDFIDDFAPTVMADIVEAMKDYGFDIRDNYDSVYDIICAVESIKAIMSRTKGLESPLHDLTKKIFGPTEEEESEGDAEELMTMFIEDLEIQLD